MEVWGIIIQYSEENIQETIPKEFIEKLIKSLISSLKEETKLKCMKSR
jgi:hypothetical protein